MTNATKAALEASLKKLLLKKPLDKITINDLTTDCGISRMAFYYHFKDIYDRAWRMRRRRCRGRKRMRHGRRACSRFLRQCSRINHLL